MEVKPILGVSSILYNSFAGDVYTLDTASLTLTAGSLVVGGTINSGNITISSPTPILVFKDSNSLGAASVGFIEWRDSGGGRAGFLGNHTSGNDDLLWKNEQGGNIGIQTTGAGEFQVTANTVLSGTLDSGKHMVLTSNEAYSLTVEEDTKNARLLLDKTGGDEGVVILAASSTEHALYFSNDFTNTFTIKTDSRVNLKDGSPGTTATTLWTINEVGDTHAIGEVRADTLFNINGADGDTASVTVITDLMGGSEVLEFRGGLFIGLK